MIDFCVLPQSDIMLRHYDKGPCRNKLGHSRASLFFHRTQVIKKKYGCMYHLKLTTQNAGCLVDRLKNEGPLPVF